MKIIVSHVGKQHVNALLIALSKRNVLVQFYTSIAANKVNLPKSMPFGIGQNLISKIQKQRFVDIDASKITHFPLISGVKKLIKSEYWRMRLCQSWFDKRVARLLKKVDYDMVIGYETSNLETFKTAQEQGKITILDMTAVHHNYQNPILTAAGVYTNQRELAYLSALKDEALDYTDYIIALSSFAEKTLIDNGFPANRIYKTYLGINQSVFYPKKTYNLGENGKWKAESGKREMENGKWKMENGQDTEGGTKHVSDTSKPLELYFVGTLMLRKGMPFLMSVLDTLIERGLNVRLTLIGPVDDFPVPTIDAPYFRYI